MLINTNELKCQQLAAAIPQSVAMLQHNSFAHYKKMVISRLVAENVLALLLQYMGLMIGTLLPNPILWLASGTACAFIFMRGYTILPGIWLGSFFAYFFAGMNGLSALACASVYAAQAFLLLYLNYRFISPTLVFYRSSLLLKFIISAGIVTAVTSFALVLICYASPQLWLQWWLANLNGVVFFGLGIVAWDIYFPQIYDLNQQNKFYLGSLYGVFIFIVMMTLFIQKPYIAAAFLVATFPIMIFISLRYGWCGATLVNCLLGLMLCFAAYFGAPIFTASLGMIALQSLVMIESIITLWITTTTGHSDVKIT